MPRKKQANEGIAQRIREARERSGLSQPEVEQHIGKAKNAVSRWERAQAQIDASDLGKLAALFGVSADWLLGVDDAFTPEESELLQDYREVSPTLRASTLAGLRAGLRMERDLSE
jgi:transcriptional regulator with XRE-family HTH domain